MQIQPSSRELVSIVLCSYNGEIYLEEQLKSIQQQTYTEIEIIVVDDCSTDKSFLIAEQAAALDSRIKCYRQKTNVGYNKNFLFGFELAKGNHISIADQDDIWILNKIEFMMSNLWVNPDVKLIHCKSLKFKNGDTPGLNKTHLYRSFKGNDVRKIFLFNAISGHNIIFKRELLPDITELPVGLYYDWWINIIACSKGVINSTEKILTHQRVHGNNATTGNDKSIYLQYSVCNFLPLILSYKNISKKDKDFGEILLKKNNGWTPDKFSFPLFFFLLKHASIFFHYKRRVFPYFSYLKMAYRISAGKIKI